MSQTNEDVLNKPEHAINYSAAVSVPVPTLDGDKQAYAKWGHRLTTWGRRERRIVANLIAHLYAYGFTVVAVDDGGDEDEAIPPGDTKAAMEAAFAVDEATMWFKRTDGESKSRYAVALIFGNGNDGLDVISDYTDSPMFSAVMTKFDAEVWA